VAFGFRKPHAGISVHIRPCFELCPERTPLGAALEEAYPK
jgi:hypothetical protein